MKRPAPVIPDSEATRLALLPARIAFWKAARTAPKLVAALEAELAALTERADAMQDDNRKDTP